jgi:hypothetical protein
MCAVAERYVFDVCWLDTGLRDRVFDGMGCHGHGGGHVETATASLGQAGSGIGNEYCFAHRENSRTKRR